MIRNLTQECFIKHPVEAVFDFFSKAENLNLITPPELHFKILTSLPVEMKKGALIDYKIKLNGIPFKWRTEITAWEPPFRFVDEQIKGPYKVWIHEHTFTQTPEGAIIKDSVDYIPKGGIFEPIIHSLLVRKKLEHIFDYRQNKLSLIFANGK